MALPKRVRIVEVGPRDGLQNEPLPIAVDDKVELINMLANAGMQYIEAGSFVSPRWVPQMADSANVFAAIERQPGVIYAALTPNMRGLEAAIQAGADEVAIFASASESFSQNNINCSVLESIERFKPVLKRASELNFPVRGYLSCVVGCPYEGEVDPSRVAEVCGVLHDLGCREISLGDTIGVGTPGSIGKMLQAVGQRVPMSRLAIHCHDTYGQALVNIYTALLAGISTVDSSVAGLGGCPYAKGASGNVATEDVLYMLQGLEIETGIDLEKTISVGNFISQRVGRRNNSRVASALTPLSD